MTSVSRLGVKHVKRQFNLFRLIGGNSCHSDICKILCRTIGLAAGASSQIRQEVIPLKRKTRVGTDCAHTFKISERRTRHAVVAHSFVAFVRRWRRLLRIFKMGNGWRSKYFWTRLDHSGGLLPSWRRACTPVNLISFGSVARCKKHLRSSRTPATDWTSPGE